MNLNQIFGSLLVLALIAFNLPAIPKLYKELVFYGSNQWNMKLDSGRPVLLQDRLMVRFSKLPLGLIKLGVLANQIVFLLMPFIAAANGVIERGRIH
jgi:hypothetical protein